MSKKIHPFTWKTVPYFWAIAMLLACFSGFSEGGVTPLIPFLMILIVIPLITLYILVDELEKRNGEQQNQIDELKRELENRKQK